MRRSALLAIVLPVLVSCVTAFLLITVLVTTDVVSTKGWVAAAALVASVVSGVAWRVVRHSEAFERTYTTESEALATSKEQRKAATDADHDETASAGV